MKNNKLIKKIIYPILAVAGFIFLWHTAATIAGREMILPSPLSTLKSFFALIATGDFWNALFSTLLRSLISFIFSFALALILAVLSVLYNWFYRMITPIILILRATPTISIILLSLIWLKSGTAPMFIAFLIVFPALFAAIYGAIISVDSGLIEMSKVYKVSKKDTLTKLYIPAVLPSVFVTVKSNISLNLKIIIASEVLAYTFLSMGREMQISKLNLETSVLMAWTVAAVLLSYLLELFVELIKKFVIRWKV